MPKNILGKLRCILMSSYVEIIWNLTECCYEKQDGSCVCEDHKFVKPVWSIMRVKEDIVALVIFLAIAL